MVKITREKIENLKLNENNPRTISDDNFDKLKQSIQSFTKMLELRPIIVDENNVVMGGNMRLLACQEVGIDFASTPFSKKEVDFLVDVLDAPFIKVASMDLNNYPFLEYIAKKNRPIVLSTGLSELYEIDKAVRTIEDAGNKEIVILHCVSKYPPRDEEVNLNNINTLQQIYPYPVGFSDHTLGYEIPLASVAFGACIIEKHFTLDKNLEGWDHKVSATPDELEIIVKGSKRIQKALGSFRISAVEDLERRIEFRRSIVITRDIKSGERIKEEDIDFKRPARGLAPEMAKFVIGRKVNRDLKADSILKEEYLD